MITRLTATAVLTFGLALAAASPSMAAPKGAPMSRGMAMSYASATSATRYGRAPMVRKAKYRATGWCGR